MATRRTVLYSGTVQGVGFRWTTRRAAAGFDVSGQVRNLPDGRVEVVAEGSSDQVAEFLQALESRMAEYIRDKQADSGPATGEFEGFGIAH